MTSLSEIEDVVEEDVRRGGGGCGGHICTCTSTEMEAKRRSFSNGSTLGSTSALLRDAERSLTLETAARIPEAGMEAGILVEAGLAVVSSDVS